MLAPGPAAAGDGPTGRVTLVQANFDRLRQVLDRLGIDAAGRRAGRPWRLLRPARRRRARASAPAAGPLDMRLDTEEGEPAANLLRRLNERDWPTCSGSTARRGSVGGLPEDRRDAPADARSRRRSNLPSWCARCVPWRRAEGRRRPGDRGCSSPAVAVNDAARGGWSGCWRPCPGA